MQLYILRHANADTEAKNDDDRQLSEKGIMQSRRVARFCEAHGIVPKLIITSPIRRAHQTAKIVADHLRVEMEIINAFACGARPEAFLHEIKERGGSESIMVVGHEPDLSHFVAHLIGTEKAENLHVRKGTLLGLELFGFEAGAGRMEFMLPPKFV